MPSYTPWRAFSSCTAAGLVPLLCHSSNNNKQVLERGHGFVVPQSDLSRPLSEPLPAGWRPSSCTSDLRLLRASTISLYSDTLSHFEGAIFASLLLCIFLRLCIVQPSFCPSWTFVPRNPAPRLISSGAHVHVPLFTDWSPAQRPPFESRHQLLHRPHSFLGQLQGCRQDTIPFTTNGAPPLSLRLPGGASILCWHFKLPRHTLALHWSLALEHYNHLTAFLSRSSTQHPFPQEHDPKPSFLHSSAWLESYSG